MSFWWFPLFAGLVPTRGRDGHQASAETALMEAINALLFVWWQWAGEAVVLFSLHFFGWHFSNSICPGQNRLNQIDGPSYGTEAFCIMKVFTKNSWLGVAFAGRAESLTECVLNILPPFLLLLSSCYHLFPTRKEAAKGLHLECHLILSTRMCCHWETFGSISQFHIFPCDSNLMTSHDLPLSQFLIAESFGFEGCLSRHTIPKFRNNHAVKWTHGWYWGWCMRPLPPAHLVKMEEL